ncbi:2-methylcitrate dehydratase PrpD [Glonium stellatum]|uniref:2-methylcitrate dehydratase PrpD n=1 Tax=Glonium stellatum TaxID=574774 RepID=A0A8E2JY30_9PEZI|nr:2-methylcitrate dehydratase PrpD [Glonium stellatum]
MSSGDTGGRFESPTERLALWATGLNYNDLSESEVERTKELFVDWLACTLAGRENPAIKAIGSFVRQTGPLTGKSEMIDHQDGTSPALAALVNGASSHVVEQDDLHNSSMSHAATVIFPSALAVVQAIEVDGREFIAACVVGYEVMCRTSEYLGKTHYEQTISALGTAGTQASGLWQFLLDATHSKQVHTAEACFDGIFAAYTAQAGLLGPHDILEGKRGMGAMLDFAGINPSAIDRELGVKYSVLESSFKWHASCRHTHPSVDALLKLMQRNKISFEDIRSVKCRTYQAAIDLLSLSERVKYGQAMITDFTEDALNDTSLRTFQKFPKMEYDPEIDAAFPKKWQGIVEVTTNQEDHFQEMVLVVKGDPGWTLTRKEIETKVKSLAGYENINAIGHVKENIRRAWRLEDERNLKDLFPCET